jgi:hypothetical protein
MRHASPIWVFALWTPFYSYWSFHMAVEEIVDRSALRSFAYLALGITSAFATPLIIALPWLL